jgi:hypothetical protein
MAFQHVITGRECSGDVNRLLEAIGVFRYVRRQYDENIATTRKTRNLAIRSCVFSERQAASRKRNPSGSLWRTVQ